MRWLEKVRRLSSMSIVMYCVAAAIMFIIADPRKAVIERLNTVLDWGDYPAQLDKGSEPYNERRLRMAVRYYKLVAKLLPGSDQPEAMIGYCYARLGEVPTAIKNYKRALEKRKDHVWLSYNLAVLYANQKEPKLSMALLEGVIQMDPRTAMEAAALAPLSRMSAEQRKILLLQAVNFSVEIRQRAYQLKMVLENDPDHYPGDVQVVLHPWVYFIQPGKELYL